MKLFKRTSLASAIFKEVTFTPSNLTTSFNSTFRGEMVSQGLLQYNADLEMANWQTGEFSSINTPISQEYIDGYVKYTALQTSFSCANTGVYRAVLESQDYSELRYDTLPVFVAGINYFYDKKV